MGRLGWLSVALIMLTAVLLRNSLLFTMGLILTLVGLAAWLWSRYCLVEVRYARRFGSTRLFFGESTDLWIEVTNAKPLPLAWLRAEDELPGALDIQPDARISRYSGGRRLLVNLFSLRWYERVIRRYHVSGAQRGAWVFGPAQLISGDIFGFSLRRMTVEEQDILLVYPRMVPITQLGLPARHPFGEAKAERRVVEDPMRLMGVREYQQGDSFRHVHWKASARRPELQTKVFEPSASRLMLIFLNVDTFRNRMEGADAVLREWGITAAASIARHAWEAGETVGIYANGTLPGGGRLRIAPGSRADQAVRILEGLALMRNITITSFEQMIQAETETLRYGSTIVVVTSVVDEVLERPLLDLRRRGHAVTIVHPGHHPPARTPAGMRLYHIGNGQTLDGTTIDEDATLELA
ncbi:MAG: DUF58 domain-containing protein [Caldilineaceae bacterium]|nr:DUF58 domain-containing protein [Caldilineaceae bacterium]